MRTQIIAAMCVGLALSSCDIVEPRDGDWPAMKWRSDRYETVKLNGKNYYSVPIEGGSYEFICKNYAPWLSVHRFIVDDVTTYSYQDTTHMEERWHHYANDWCSVDAVKDTIRVRFAPNEGRARMAFIDVTAGDVFDVFQFIQQSPLYTE